MRNKSYIWISGFICIVVLISGIWFLGGFEQESSKQALEEVELSKVEMKKARSEYFFRMLRDPAKNEIPENIRSRELSHAKKLPGRSGFLRKGQSGQTIDISWQLAGPNELGGRTRALAVDKENSDVILAGGVSGGVWKSIDGGNTWEMKTDPNQNMSVTSLAQDPTNPDTWYYTSGEYRGNSASDRGNTAFYYGTGIYKSTDKGENWSVIPSTEDTDTGFNSKFDYLSKIKVSPTTGSIFVASNGVGLLRSTDGTSFSIVKGGLNEHTWTDFDIDQQGNIVAVLSSENLGPSGNSGIFYSTDDGSSWTEITPSTFPLGHSRSVIAFAPSNPTSLYVFTRKTQNSTNPDANQGVSFFKIDVTDPQNPVASDRSANLPNFGGSGGVDTQVNYNMLVTVKPDDPDFVMVGATNLFRSQDGFATAPSGTGSSEKDKYWVGGYAKVNNNSQYPGHHPDQHVIAYDSNDPNKVWSGHDGGLSLTSDITASSVTWQNKDDGYVTGQFYSVAIPSNKDDNRLLGGTQDNGTPFFRYDGSSQQQTTSLLNVSAGDGAYSFWGTDYAYVSTQRGKVLRLKIESDGSLESPYERPVGEWADVYPNGAKDQLFIHPYEVDPNDETIMYYPGGGTMWRNTDVDQIQPYNQDGIQGATNGWDDFSAVSSGYTISALDVTKSQPSDRLYYAAYSYSSSPKIFSVDNASSSWNPVDISISGAPTGAYVHDIAVNPHDGDEIIAVMSNYGITGLYHSTDGGSNWEAIEGNLDGTSGPSLRNATILPTSAGTIYFVGTSTGVYSTTSLAGSSTTWSHESPGSIGYSVSEHIVSRPIDGKIAVGTHGRGIFVGQTNVQGVQPPMVDVTLDIGNTWRLVGSPMPSTSDVSIDGDLTLFGFSGTYESAMAMEPNTGYWVKSRSGSQINFNGDVDSTATIALQKGWNMIGGVTDTVSVSNIKDPGGIRSSTPVYEYVDGSYQSATQIKSTHGYWIHADQAGNIELSSGSSSGKNYLAIPNEVDKIEFSSRGASQFFYVASQSLDRPERGHFLMPPKAPQPILDLRTPDGYRVAKGESTELEMTTVSYPVTISTPQSNSSNYILKGVSGKDTVYYDLKSDAEVSIQRPHQKFLLEQSSAKNRITKHNLLPNYPNPFNPTTRIRYEIASQAEVLVEVYDVLGRKVRTLVNKQQPQGTYTVQFDGRNLSSGTYFIHLKAAKTAKVQKMTLIK